MHFVSGISISIRVFLCTHKFCICYHDHFAYAIVRSLRLYVFCFIFCRLISLIFKTNDTHFPRQARWVPPYCTPLWIFFEQGLASYSRCISFHRSTLYISRCSFLLTGTSGYQCVAPRDFCAGFCTHASTLRCALVFTARARERRFSVSCRLYSCIRQSVFYRFLGFLRVIVFAHFLFSFHHRRFPILSTPVHHIR